VPDESPPKSRAFIKLISNVNSFVNGFRSNRNTPTQKPTHIGQLKKGCFGRIFSKILEKTKICVSPYEHNIK
jgi:hypothetical protein